MMYPLSLIKLYTERLINYLMKENCRCIVDRVSVLSQTQKFIVEQMFLQHAKATSALT